VAILIGILLRCRPDGTGMCSPWWSHLLLGGANVVFWSAFSAFDTVALGLLATIAHGVFVLAQLRAWFTYGADVSRPAGFRR
jgi:hypothetical protein